MPLSQAGEITPCNRHHAISLLFANDPQLFHFFFTEDRLTLRWDAEKFASMKPTVTLAPTGSSA